MKYHINPVSGKVGLCSAKKSCPFGGPAEHFATEAEAMEHYEEVMASMTIPEPTAREVKKESLIRAAEAEILRGVGAPDPLQEAQRIVGEASLLVAIEKEQTKSPEEKLKDLAHEKFEEIKSYGEFLKSEDSFYGDKERALWQETSERLAGILTNYDWQDPKGAANGMLTVLQLHEELETKGEEAAMRGEDPTPYWTVGGGLIPLLEGSIDLIEPEN